MNGPEATAGSILIFIKKIGIAEPIRLQIVIASKSDNPTIPAAFKASK